VNTKRRWIRLLAAMSAFTLLAAACGDDDDAGEAVTDAIDDITDDNGDTDDADEPDPNGDGLVMGYVLPQDGPLGFLGPPQIESVLLAVEDINDAGGVLGADVTLLEGNEGETPQIAAETVDGLLADGAHVIIGAAASGSSQEFIGTLFQQEIPQCSASNTSPAFSDQDNAEYYFRTVPPDEAVAPIIADQVIADGNESVVIVSRADDYGEALAGLVSDALGEQGADVAAEISYNPEADNFASEVEQAVDANADAVVLIAFDEGGDIVAGMLEQGIVPEQIYGGDGVFGPTFIEQVDEGDENVIDGMTVIGAAGDEQFNERIADPTDNNFIYGGQAYDCAILLALAVEQVGAVDDGAAIVEAAKEISGGDGDTCTSFEECIGMIQDGQDVNYDGASGTIELDDVGDPTAGRYAIGRFTEGSIEIIDSVDVEL
jgi:ABC-type branched-subunit amino acid transport system substrate-binding protein